MAEVPRTNRVQVINRGPKEYEETIRGETYRFKKGEARAMGRREAIDFLGTYPGDGIIKKFNVEAMPESGDALADKALQHYVCPICQQVFATTQALDEHIQNKHRDSAAHQAIENLSKSSPAKPELFKCPWCNALFEDSNDMQKHVATHVKRGPGRPPTKKPEKAAANA